MFVLTNHLVELMIQRVPDDRSVQTADAKGAIPPFTHRQFLPEKANRSLLKRPTGFLRRVRRNAQVSLNGKVFRENAEERRRDSTAF